LNAAPPGAVFASIARQEMTQIDYPSLVARVQAAVEREIDKLDATNRQDGEAAQSEAPEGRARRLASLSRTLRELGSLQAAIEDEPESHDEDAVPRDIDELREALCQRLERLVARDKARALHDAEEP
jgi:hypothetical protein